MNFIQHATKTADQFQRRYRLPGFLYAVIKKYSDDEAGYQAALLTYYGFLSLFPLLLVLSTAAGIVAGKNPHLQHTIVSSMTMYFPVLGTQLSEHITTLHKTGLALVVGILFTLYGARGVADAFIHGVNTIWRVPKVDRPGFPKAQAKSLGIVLLAGFGLLTASVSAAAASAAGHGVAFRALSILINIFILFWLFSLLLNISLPRHVTIKEIRSGALTAAIGLVMLQALGGYLLTRELKSLDALYSNFAIPLGLLFWIYLQAQVLFYSIEIASVKTHSLWPRSLTGDHLTEADERAYAHLAKKERAVRPEHVEATFNKHS
jgi:YihY family inner membrane protein